MQFKEPKVKLSERPIFMKEVEEIKEDFKYF